jgi:aspartate kinase
VDGSPERCDGVTARPIVVQKYGGSSVATVEKLRLVAQRVVATKESGCDVVVVVSAMGDTTDELLELAAQVSGSPPKRELDMLLSVGERISMSLLSIAIADLGHKAISFTGSQCGIVTTASHSDARIIDVRPIRVQDELENGHIVIVAGFQGTSYKKEITTLGRGGSDTTAVALAAALGAERCDIFSDVDGIYTADPRVVLDAQRLEEVSYDEMQELARLGARVLNAQAVEFARRKQIAIYARAAVGDGPGTVIRRVDGFPAREIAEFAGSGVKGVTSRTDVIVAQYTDAAGALAEALEGQHTLAIVRALDGETWALVSGENLVDSAAFAEELQRQGARTRTDLASVSVVGTGVGDSASVWGEAHRALAAEGVTVDAAVAARDSVTVLLGRVDEARAVRILHTKLVPHALGH